MDKIKECPLCGSKEIGQGRQVGQGSMMPIHSIWTGSTILADICTECGYILSMRVENPHIFKVKK